MTNPQPSKLIINESEIEITFPLQPDKPTVERRTVRCIIKHWSQDCYLIIQEKKFDGIMTLLGGDIEKGQTIKQATQIEIQEESGYVNIEKIAITPYKIHNKFYNKKKEQNQYSVISLAIVQLANGEQITRSQEEIDMIDLKWVPKSELLSSVNTDMDKFFIEKFLEKLKSN